MLYTIFLLVNKLIIELLNDHIQSIINNVFIDTNLREIRQGQQVACRGLERVELTQQNQVTTFWQTTSITLHQKKINN